MNTDLAQRGVALLSKVVAARIFLRFVRFWCCSAVERLHVARSEGLGTGALRRLLRVLGESFESVVTSGAELAVYKPRAATLSEAS